MSDRIAVLIVDDHPVVRQGLRTLLELQDDLEIAGEAADGAEAVELVRGRPPDVVLMDLVMPGLDGIDATRAIRATSPATRVIVLTSFAEDDKIFPAIKAGAAGYLLKDARTQELADAIRRVHAGEALLHPKIAARLMQEVSGGQAAEASTAAELLTERELDVLRLLARGLSNKLIARELFVAEKTVKTHVSNILAKLHLTDRTQAALYAVRTRLVE